MVPVAVLRKFTKLPINIIYGGDHFHFIQNCFSQKDTCTTVYFTTYTNLVSMINAHQSVGKLSSNAVWFNALRESSKYCIKSLIKLSLNKFRVQCFKLICLKYHPFEYFNRPPTHISGIKPWTWDHRCDYVKRDITLLPWLPRQVILHFMSFVTHFLITTW